MARVEISEVIALSTTGEGINGAVVTVTHTDTSPANIYDSETNPTPLTQPVTSDHGRIVLWVDEGTYVLNINPAPTGPIFTPQSLRIEALSGAAIVSSRTYNIVGVLYTGPAPARPTTPGAFVLWNGDTDPGANAINGDLGIGWQ